MRILHCLSTHEVAGTERHVAELASYQSLTHEVTLLCERDSADPLTGDDIARHLAPSVRLRRAGRLGYAAALAALTRRERFDIVHTHLGRASFRAGWLARGRVPLVATIHNRFVARAFGRHDALIAVAGWQREAIPPEFAGPVEVIGNWTRAGPPDAVRRAAVRAALGVADETFLIGAAGRFVPEKRFDLLLEAFAEAALPDVRLILFGVGLEEARLRAMAGPGVIWGGYRPDLPADMAALDGFVLPSRREPFGLVLLEAMAANLPVRATAAGGVPDILGAFPQSLVPPDDRQAMASALRALRLETPRRWPMEGWRLPAKARAVEALYGRFSGA